MIVLFVHQDFVVTVLLEYLDFHAKRDKLQLLNFYQCKSLPASFMLEYDLQPVVTHSTYDNYDDDDWSY